jgi:hypothetical protein
VGWFGTWCSLIVMSLLLLLWLATTSLLYTVAGGIACTLCRCPPSGSPGHPTPQAQVQVNNKNRPRAVRDKFSEPRSVRVPFSKPRELSKGFRITAVAVAVRDKFSESLRAQSRSPREFSGKIWENRLFSVRYTYDRNEDNNVKKTIS